MKRNIRKHYENKVQILFSVAAIASLALLIEVRATGFGRSVSAKSAQAVTTLEPVGVSDVSIIGSTRTAVKITPARFLELRSAASSLSTQQEIDELAARRVRVRFAGPDSKIIVSQTIRLARHRDWIGTAIGAVPVDPKQVYTYLLTHRPARLTMPTHCTFDQLVIDDHGVVRAVMKRVVDLHRRPSAPDESAARQTASSSAPASADAPSAAEAPCIASDGYSYDAATAAVAIVQALASRTITVTIPVEYAYGTITDALRSPPVTFQTLSLGQSDFHGSGEGRKFNVRKGLKDKINGIVVEPGETFSFLRMLGDVRIADGWKLALGIFNGDELHMTPGGGICQVSTTLYRAVLLAGLPIEKWKNHSLFVHYYESYGVGLDATVFGPSLDFTFVNDTGNRLLVQAFTEGDMAFIRFFGVPDERTVALKGPYFAANSPAEWRATKRTVKANQIAWTRQITRADGSTSEEFLLSRYKELPRSVVEKWKAKPQATFSGMAAR